MKRIAILNSAGLLAAQIAQELAKHGHSVVIAEPESDPLLPKIAGPCRPVTHEPCETFKGKRVAQWKRERSR